MENSKEVSRQEFLKFIPRYVVQNARSLLQGRLNLSNDSVSETSEENSTHIKAKVVQLESEHCLAWGGGNCQFCYVVCPLRDKAITLDDQKPIVNILFCDGCAKCVTACRTVNDRPAIKMIYKSVTQVLI